MRVRGSSSAKRGDFYTSSDVHAVFGRLLARQFEEMWRALGSPQRIDLVELGPGRGLFAADVLDWSAKQFPEFAQALRYSLVEQSEHLRARLRERLAEHIAAGKARVCDSLESAGAEGLSSLRDSNGFDAALPGAESAGLSSAAPPARGSSEDDAIRKLATGKSVAEAPLSKEVSESKHRDDEGLDAGFVSPTEQAAEKLLAAGKRADPSPLKRFGMTKTHDFCGTAKAVPFQNRAPQSFSAASDVGSTDVEKSPHRHDQGRALTRIVGAPGSPAGAEELNHVPLILFANEFFDALPIEIVDHRGAVRVGEEQGRFIEQFVPPSAEELAYIDRYSVHPEAGERVEVSLAALNWMDRIAQLFRNRAGFAMFIDYGYTREEQLAGRHRDTLMTYRQHRASASPYEAPGEQDITAHVNFTALRSRAAEAGLDEIALLTQTQLLLGIGEETQFADAFQDCQLPQERAKVALQLRHLLSPEEMGEKFQVLLLSRGVDADKARELKSVRNWMR